MQARSRQDTAGTCVVKRNSGPQRLSLSDFCCWVCLLILAVAAVLLLAALACHRGKGLEDTRERERKEVVSGYVAREGGDGIR